MAFRLTETFIDQYAEKQPDWGPLGYVTYKRTYARPLEDGGTEEYWQTCRRVVEGTYQIQESHCQQFKLPWSAAKAQRSAQEMYRRMWAMKFLPPGRGLWAMGTHIVEKLGAGALFNCAFTSTKDLKTDFAGPFCFLMDMSMLGVGVGFDTLGAGTVKVKTPPQCSPNADPRCYGTEPIKFVVEDSREGWVALIRRVLESYVPGEYYLPLEIDYSEIRPAGTPLKTFGGTAAGPQPLIECVEDIHKILRPLIGQTITTTAIVDLMNVIGRCVVSGNIRRSAELAIGQVYDNEYLELKDPEKHREEMMHHRWASNNSVVVTEEAKLVYGTSGRKFSYDEVAALTAKNGEPGYIWLDNARRYARMDGHPNGKDERVMGFNPCSEQPLEDREMCCLVETFPSRHDSLEDYLRTLKFAYLYGKTVTLVPTHDSRTNAVILRNRRIGTSQSGIIQSFQRIGRREHFRWSDEGYNYLRRLDGVYSDWLCVPRSIKITTVKPSGTVSLLPGVTPGIHYPHSEFYYRTIRFNADSPLVRKLKKAGYRIEDDAYSPNTKVVYFGVHESWFDRSKDEVSMWEQLENVAQMQQYWSDNGVSATITFKPEEASHIVRALELYETRLKAISFLPLSDHGYVQAPYITITKEEFDNYTSKLKTVNWAGEETNEQQDRWCDGDICLIGTAPTEAMVA